jgi:hypothetical protein
MREPRLAFGLPSWPGWLVPYGSWLAVLVLSGCAHAQAAPAKQAGAEYLDCPLDEMKVELTWEHGQDSLWEVECRDFEHLSSAKVSCHESRCTPQTNDHHRPGLRNLL